MPSRRSLARFLPGLGLALLLLVFPACSSEQGLSLGGSQLFTPGGGGGGGGTSTGFASLSVDPVSLVGINGFLYEARPRVRNTGTAAATSLVISGVSDPFTADLGDCPSSLAPGADCRLRVRLVATVGIVPAQTLRLTFTHPGGQGTASATLSGEARFGGATSPAGAWSAVVDWGRIFSGDLDGDGRGDLVGWLPSASQWWAGTSRPTGLVNSLFHQHSGAVTWANPLSGDFDGDGRADVAARVLESGDWWVTRSLGNGTGSAALWGNFSKDHEWVEMLAGDLNGDGKDDVVGRVASGHWWAGISTGTGFTNVAVGHWNPDVTWRDVSLQDMNGDGKRDLIGRVEESGAWWAGISSGSSVTNVLMGSFSPNVSWKIRYGDMNDDGKTDVVGLTGSAFYAGISNGQALENRHLATFSTALDWTDLLVADFNGDDRADFLARTVETGEWWIGVTRASGLVISAMGTWSPQVQWSEARALDYDGDRKADVIARDPGTGHWWLLKSLLPQ